MPNPLSYGAATHVGLIRTNNEDCYLAEPNMGLWLIADGMGGHDAGEVASDIVKNSIKESVSASVELSMAIERSHEAVKDAASNGIGSTNMGTTVIAMQDFGAYYQIAWVGDSRAYLWDTLNGKLTQLSRDHSYVQALFDAGSITHEEMHSHPQKNVITQSLGIAELDEVRVDSINKNWLAKQKVLLCSDGLSDLLTDQDIEHYCRKLQGKSEQTLVDTLIQAALDRGGKDNVTVEVISAPVIIPGHKGAPFSFSLSSLLIPALVIAVSIGAAVLYRLSQ
ncbi:MAG: serine/threonine-protein phosphatase [Sinobacterium sp.]|nr:serine/threonine-protein phosphatase [Sinobacterium sp.]